MHGVDSLLQRIVTDQQQIIVMGQHRCQCQEKEQADLPTSLAEPVHDLWIADGEYGAEQKQKQIVRNPPAHPVLDQQVEIKKAGVRA